MQIFFDRYLFCADLPGIGKLASIDVGTKTLGVAISDARRSIASADLTIKRISLSKDISTVCNYITDKQITGIIIGWPLNMDGTEGKQCDYIMKFTDTLTQFIDRPVLLWDERLSSVAVDRVLIHAGTRRDKRKKVIDALAAAYILQGVLDTFNMGKITP